ncbi:MAG: GNAT family N-acetyltransferase [Thalassobaculaceae bacterium]|nr:GNAT family N-acetyltransferase [Thalassobaculaceae bacterium]
MTGSSFGPVIDTRRLRLRPWCDGDLPVFAALHADSEVMRDLGGPVDEAASRAKLTRYRTAFVTHGVCRWAVETRDGVFVGYAGVMPSSPGHPLGEHFDIGWRLCRGAWGEGYATEAAAAALADVFARSAPTEVLAYTAADNWRSQAVMTRLGLVREPTRDFTLPDGTDDGWHGLVWSIRRHEDDG